MSIVLAAAFAALLQTGDGSSTFERVAAVCSRYATGAETASGAISGLTEIGFSPTGSSDQAPLQEFVLRTAPSHEDHLFFLDGADPLDGQTGVRMCIYYPGDRDMVLLRQQVLTLSPAAPNGMKRERERTSDGWLYGSGDQLRLIVRIPPGATPPHVAFTGGD